MSVIIQPRGEVGGGVAAHLQCSLCGHFSKSHAHQLTHVATSHPTSLDSVSVGRLGNIVMYQSTARLFHCSECFFTSRDFTKLYKHIISRHCMDETAGEKTEEEAEEEKDKKEGGKVEEEGGKHEKDMGKEEVEGGKDEKEGEKEEKEKGIKIEKEPEMEEEKDGRIEEMKMLRTEEEQAVKREESTQEEMEGGKEEKDAEMGEKETLKRKRSSEAEEDVECHEESPTLQKPVTVKTEAEGDESVLVFDGAGYRCLICNWRSSKKGPGINHVVRKHDIPRAYAHQSLRQHLDATLKQSQGSGGAEEEEGVAAGLTGEMLKEEMEVVSKVVRFIASRFVCLICGWKTKLKGFAISHVERSHEVERPYRCKICKLAFFLPSRMQQHVSTAHRPGRYACPFCCFRSEYLGGFRRHCSRCNAREEGEEDGGGEEGEEGNEEDEVEEVKETRRKRRRVVKVMKEEDTEDEDEEDD